MTGLPGGSDAACRPEHPVLLRRSLEGIGLGASAVADYLDLRRVAEGLLDTGRVPEQARRTWIVPGRIEVLGKHVDYAGGRSLLCAVERGLVIVARPRTDRQLVLHDARRGDVLTLPFDGSARHLPSWSVYPRTVLHRLLRNFGEAVGGADIAIASNLPSAAGVSSSSALTVGLSLAVAGVSGLSAHPVWQETFTARTALAGYVGALENGMDFGALSGERGVGTLGGAQDQTAILCSSPGALAMFQWAPVTWEQVVPWPETHRFVIGVSGVTASKAAGAKERYNRAARTAHRLVEGWNAQARASGAPPVRSLREAFVAAAAGETPREVPEPLIASSRAVADAEFTARHLEARLEQFFDETFVFVPEAAAALAAGDLAAFGALVDRSQAGAERALENQVAETIHLQRFARELGAEAASAFGAGFGGSVWAMIPADQAEEFSARWRERYVRAHRQAASRAQFFTTAPSHPAFEVAD